MNLHYLYTENYETLLREIKINGLVCIGWKTKSLLRCQFSPDLSIDFPIKIQKGIFVEIVKLILNFGISQNMEIKMSKIIKMTQKQNKGEALTQPNFQT